MKKIILFSFLLFSLSNAMAEVICKTSEIQVNRKGPKSVEFITSWDGGFSEIVGISKGKEMSPKKNQYYFSGYLQTAYSDSTIDQLTSEEYKSVTSLVFNSVGDFAGLIDFKDGSNTVAKFISTTSGYVARCK